MFSPDLLIAKQCRQLQRVVEVIWEKTVSLPSTHRSIVFASGANVHSGVSDPKTASRSLRPFSAVNMKNPDTRSQNNKRVHWKFLINAANVPYIYAVYVQFVYLLDLLYNYSCYEAKSDRGTLCAQLWTPHGRCEQSAVCCSVPRHCTSSSQVRKVTTLLQLTWVFANLPPHAGLPDSVVTNTHKIVLK